MRWSKFVMEEQTDKPILEVGRLTSWYQMKLMQLFQCTQPVLEYCHTPRIAGDRWQNEMKSVWFCSILSKFTPVFNFDRASHEYEKFARSRDLQNLNVWVGRQAITWSRQSSEWSPRRQGGYLGRRVRIWEGVGILDEWEGYTGEEGLLEDYLGVWREWGRCVINRVYSSLTPQSNTGHWEEGTHWDNFLCLQKQIEFLIWHHISSWCKLVLLCYNFWRLCT